MEKYTNFLKTVACLGFLLLNIDLTKGTVQITTSGTPYIGQLFTMTCTITPFSGTANWAKNGTTVSTCSTSFCAPSALDNATFSYNASGISVTINPVSISDGGSWECNHPTGSETEVLQPTIFSLTLQTSTLLATESTSTVSNIFELRYITTLVYTGGITSTIDISIPTTFISYLNTDATYIYVKSESSNYYSNTEIANSIVKHDTTHAYANSVTENDNANTETTNEYADTETMIFLANSETYKSETETTGIISNTTSMYQDAFFSTSVNDVTMSVFPETKSREITEMSASPGYSVSSDEEISLLATFETKQFFQSFSPSSLANVIGHQLSLQTTEYYASLQSELTSYVTTSFYESNKHHAATEIYSKEIVTSGTSYMHTSVMSATKLASMNIIQYSTIDFPSTYFDPYSQSTDGVLSSKQMESLSSTLQSTSSFLHFNTRANTSGDDSNMKTTNLLTFESHSVTMDLPRFTNPFSNQISTVLTITKTARITENTNFNSKTMPSMIKPSSQQTHSGKSFFEIKTSFKDSSLYYGSFSRSLPSNDPVTTTLSSGVFKSISTLPTSTIQSELSDKTQNIIFISTSAAFCTIIILLLFIILARMYMSKDTMKPSIEDTNISWSINSCSPSKAFNNHSFIGENKHTMLYTSSYEYNWNDIM